MTNKIILGTVQFGLDYGINNTSGKPGKEEVASIFDLAFKNNIRLLDTAEAYGDSQEVIGAYHKASSNRFEVITKFSPSKYDPSLGITGRIQKDLEALQVDHLYGYMFHSFGDFETYYTTFKEEIAALREKGIIKNFGVSIYSNQEIDALLKYEGIDFIQFPFNVLDNISQRAALIARAKARGIEIHTRSVFLQGLIFKDPQQLTGKLSPMTPYLDQVQAISKQNHLDLNDLALNYAVQQEDIDYVLIGVDTAEQLRRNMASLRNELPDSVVEKINAVSVKETELLNPSNWK